jgi:aspartyl protease family protein
MGTEDKEWWRKAQMTRKQRALFFEKSTHLTPSIFNFQRLIQQLSLGWILAFWLVVVGAVYLGMNHYMNKRNPIVSANGALTIKKDRDGHFRIPGAINGQPVNFLVDTGATIVSISDEIAHLSKLADGEPAQFQTAAGSRSGFIVSGVTVRAGPLSVSNIRVGTGLKMSATNEALLGQNFLSKFKMSMSKDSLTLTAESSSQ